MESPCAFCDKRDKVLYAKSIIHELLKYLPPSKQCEHPELRRMKEVIQQAEDFVK